MELDKIKKQIFLMRIFTNISLRYVDIAKLTFLKFPHIKNPLFVQTFRVAIPNQNRHSLEKIYMIPLGNNFFCPTFCNIFICSTTCRSAFWLYRSACMSLLSKAGIVNRQLLVSCTEQLWIEMKQERIFPFFFFFYRSLRFARMGSAEDSRQFLK